MDKKGLTNRFDIKKHITTPQFLLRLAIKLVALALYIMLLFDFGTGKVFHMAAGTAVCILTVSGLLLDRENLRVMRGSFRDCTLSTSDAVLLSTETLVALEMAIMLVTGVLNRVEPGYPVVRMVIYGLHVASAFLTPAIMAVRIGIQMAKFFGKAGDNGRKTNGNDGE